MVIAVLQSLVSCQGLLKGFLFLLDESIQQREVWHLAPDSLQRLLSRRRKLNLHHARQINGELLSEMGNFSIEFSIVNSNRYLGLDRL